MLMPEECCLGLTSEDITVGQRLSTLAWIRSGWTSALRSHCYGRPPSEEISPILVWRRMAWYSWGEISKAVSLQVPEAFQPAVFHHGAYGGVLGLNTGFFGSGDRVQSTQQQHPHPIGIHRHLADRLTWLAHQHQAA